MPTFPKNKGFGSKKKDERLGSKPTMMPGGNSDINPGIFAGKEVKKYQAMKAHPMRYEPMNAVDGKSHADLKAAGGKAFDIHMRDHGKGVFPTMSHPSQYKPMAYADVKKMNFKPQQAKPDFPDVDGDGNKEEPITKATKDLQAKAIKGTKPNKYK
tara:strand:- start:490 stop:957 length:468 start_codon:yes stop_codon:yes gene_type:complete